MWQNSFERGDRMEEVGLKNSLTIQLNYQMPMLTVDRSSNEGAEKFTTTHNELCSTHSAFTLHFNFNINCHHNELEVDLHGCETMATLYI